jgi:hypothetical protein
MACLASGYLRTQGTHRRTPSLLDQQSSGSRSGSLEPEVLEGIDSVGRPKNARQLSCNLHLSHNIHHGPWQFSAATR